MKVRVQRQAWYHQGMREAALLSLLLLGCDGDPEPAAPALRAPDKAAESRPQIEGPTAGGITWEAPDPFRSRRPTGGMRAAEYVVPEQNQGETPAMLTVFHFGRGRGGTVDENVQRWLGQIERPAGAEPSIRGRRVSGLSVTVVDVVGTYREMSMPGAAPAVAVRDQRFLGAVVEAPDGLVFFKLVGERVVVDRAGDAFEALIDTIRPVR